MLGVWTWNILLLAPQKRALQGSGENKWKIPLPKAGMGKGQGQAWGSLTQGCQVPVVVQHHLPIQTPLLRTEPRPLLLGENYSHIPKCHQALK